MGGVAIKHLARSWSFTSDLVRTHPRRITLLGVLSLELVFLVAQYGLGTDALFYADGGIAILHQNNPFIDPPFTDPRFSIGPAAAVALALLRSITIWQSAFLLGIALLNLLGALMFLRLVVPKLTFDDTLIVLSILPLTAAYRVGFADGQMAGILLLLLVTARRLTLSSFAPWRLVTGGLLATAAFDLKPHIALVFFLVFAFELGIRRILAWMATVVVFHLAVNIWLSRWYEADWLHVIQRLAARATENRIEQSPWQPFSNASVEPTWVLLLQYSTLIAAFIGVALVARTGRISLALICAATVPLLLAYQHMYDPIGLAVIAVSAQLIFRHVTIAALLLGFLFLPATDVQPLSLLIACGQALLVLTLTSTDLRFKDLSRRFLALIAPIVLLGLAQISKIAEPWEIFSGFLILQLLAAIAFLRYLWRHLS